jgi:carboxyl-terminal processing protease
MGERNGRVSAYLKEALTLIRRTALFSDTVDWDATRREADTVLADATAYADTHEFLTRILKAAGGRHSHLTAPRTRGNPSAHLVLPTGELINNVARLNLPRLPGGFKGAHDYVRAGVNLRTELTASHPTGWIVDLRRNIGGNMWPMLAVVAPLLPDGILGHFELPNGHYQSWFAKNGSIKLRKRTPHSRNKHKELTPTAVLTSKHTASAGEAVVVAFLAHPHTRSFGQPTGGYTTGNITRVLKDGTRLHISVSYYADYRRNRIDGPVPVDETVTDNALDAALEWF